MARPDDANDDHRLFLEAVAGTRPLGPSNRARIETPKPAPRPRPQAIEKKGDKPPHNRPALPITDDASLFRASIGDITPLRDSGRAALAHHRVSRHTTLNLSHPEAGVTGRTAAAPPPPPLPDIDDPAELFRRAVGAVNALPDKKQAQVARPAPPPIPIQHERDEHAALEESLLAPLSFEDRLDMGIEDAFLRDGLARRVLTDLRRGRWVIQGELDLHGLTREEARVALARFLVDALHAGKRCLRLIHGKGLGSPGRESILKQLSRTWLAQREEILAFCQARPQDGGEGALVVLLRAPRPSE